MAETVTDTDPSFLFHSEREFHSYLNGLNENIKLWKSPEPRKYSPVEVKVIRANVIHFRLIVEMISTGMFGGVSASLYSHPQYPGLPPTLVGHICHEYFPGEKPDGKAKFGCWEYLTKLYDDSGSQMWVKEFGLVEPHSYGYYSY